MCENLLPCRLIEMPFLAFLNKFRKKEDPQVQIQIWR